MSEVWVGIEDEWITFFLISSTQVQDNYREAQRPLRNSWGNKRRMCTMRDGSLSLGATPYHTFWSLLYIITGERYARTNACRNRVDNEHYNKSIILTQYHVAGKGCIFIRAYALPFFFVALWNEGILIYVRSNTLVYFGIRSHGLLHK
jgi:hypothetical protein